MSEGTDRKKVGAASTANLTTCSHLKVDVTQHGKRVEQAAPEFITTQSRG